MAKTFNLKKIEISECSLFIKKSVSTVVLNKIKIGVDEISKLPIMRPRYEAVRQKKLG
ncbi:MAG: hypothetical protein ACJAZT_000089 [Gammaproteobacteria bacterium]|jgi:hypothetical protein